MAKKKNKMNFPSGNLNSEGFRRLRMARQIMETPSAWRIDFAEASLRCGPLLIRVFERTKRASNKNDRHQYRYRCSFERTDGCVDRDEINAFDPNEAVTKRIQCERDLAYRIRLRFEFAETALSQGDWKPTLAKDSDEDKRVATELENMVRESQLEAQIAASEEADEAKFRRYDSEIENLKCRIEELRSEANMERRSTRAAYDEITTVSAKATGLEDTVQRLKKKLRDTNRANRKRKPANPKREKAMA